MIHTYGNTEGRFVNLGDDLANFADAVWIDLVHPNKDEETAIERALGIDVPTIEEMSEIELSSRLYSDDGAHFMTAMVLSHTDSDNVMLSPVTFILMRERLVTVRYARPRSVEAFVGRCQKAGTWSADALVAGLLESFVGRIGDLLERTGQDLNLISGGIFAMEPPPHSKGYGVLHRPARPRNYRSVLEQVGRKGDLLSKIRESLVSFQRLLAYETTVAAIRKAGEETDSRIRTLASDVQSLSDHTNFLTQKITFLLDATLGMINIEQTAIIKIFSVAAVVFLPPTLIASIYGMNFEFMPELAWPNGYPMALGMMLMSAVLPYMFFKWRRWL
jgi:magnesium transporter